MPFRLEFLDPARNPELIEGLTAEELSIGGRRNFNFMNMTNQTLKKVKETILRYRMIDSGDVLIVAVSGGPDSVCLLDVLNKLKDELRMKLVVAHYNHGLRQGEDESETRFVHQLATSMNLPLETGKASIRTYENIASLEEKARNARYRFLEGVKTRFHAQKIAIGHNLNDQAETVLMRLLRGSGSSGLAGIPPCRDNTIIRPLIEIKRVEIEFYLKERGISYVTDSSNYDTKHLRNKIRLELIPLLLQYQPRLIEHLGHLADLMREENQFLELLAQEWVEKEAEPKTNREIIIPLPAFKDLSQPLRNRVIRHLFKMVGKGLRRIDLSHTKSVYKLACGKNPQGMLNLPHGLIVKKVYDRLHFTMEPLKKSSGFCYVLEKPGIFSLDQIDRSISLVEMENSSSLEMVNSPLIAYLDAERIKYPLIARNLMAGDRFIPLGMVGHKKIKNLFIELKIPSDERRLIPILISEDTPVWICGYRIDERFKITSETKKILIATLHYSSRNSSGGKELG